MAKLFIIFSAMLALMISKCHVAVSMRTIAFPNVAPSSPISKDCSLLFSADMGDYCAPFLSNEESKPDDILCCSALDYQISVYPECFCDMMGNNDLSSSFKKLPSLCQLTLPCDINAGQVSSPIDSPAPHDPVSPVPSPAPESESPTPSPSVTSPEPKSPTPTPSVTPIPEPQSPTPTPSVEPIPEPQSPTTSSTPSAPSPSPKALPNTSPEPKHSSASLAAQSHSLLVFVLLTTSILFLYFY